MIDSGRRTLPGDLVLYLFGTPGQRRFKPLREDFAHGALAALGLVDTQRLGDSFEVIDMSEERVLQYAIAVNAFPDAPDHPPAVLRDRLDLGEHTPLVICDARDSTSSIDALIARLLGRVLELAPSARRAGLAAFGACNRKAVGAPPDEVWGRSSSYWTYLDDSDNAASVRARRRGPGGSSKTRPSASPVRERLCHAPPSATPRSMVRTLLHTLAGDVSGCHLGTGPSPFERQCALKGSVDPSCTPHRPRSI